MTAPAASAGEAGIRVESLVRHYGTFRAVDAISFAVQPGEVMGLVGPNGAGKTTTLRCLAGIIAPSSGRVLVAGHDIQRDPVAAKRALAFIPDEPRLFEHLTVEEHLRFVGRLYGVADVEARIGPVLEELELVEKRRVLSTELSRGMKQKLAIACGLLHDPRVLILDEPLTGLDPAGMRRMRATIVAHARAGAAVILSSHLLTLVEELCSSLFVIRRGQGVAAGTIASIVAARPELAGLSLEEIFLALTTEERVAQAPAGEPRA